MQEELGVLGFEYMESRLTCVRSICGVLDGMLHVALLVLECSASVSESEVGCRLFDPQDCEL